MTAPLPAPTLILRPLTAETLDAALPSLAGILQACVLEGSGVGFILPFPIEEAADFWQGRREGLASGARHILVAELDGAIVGTVSLELAGQPNGRNRAEIAKMLVHPAARRRGIARALLAEAERLALSLGRKLLVLDTVTGDRAEKLYPSCGYVKVGVIPDYAALPDGRMEGTTVFYKALA